MSDSLRSGDRCRVLRPDGQFHRGYIQNGPFDDHGIYFYVHIHNPTNKHEYVWNLFLRPEFRYGQSGTAPFSNVPSPFPFVAFDYSVPPPSQVAIAMANQAVEAERISISLNGFRFNFSLPYMTIIGPTTSSGWPLDANNQPWKTDIGTGTMLTVRSNNSNMPVPAIVSNNQRSLTSNVSAAAILPVDASNTAKHHGELQRRVSPTQLTGKGFPVNQETVVTKEHNDAYSSFRQPSETVTATEPAAKRPTLQLANASTLGRASSSGRITASSPHEPPPLELLEGPMIEVSVGRPGSLVKEKTWCLPRALLSHFSPFFQEISGGIIVTPSKTLSSLPNTNPAAFSLFVQWMYWGSYNPPGGVLSAVDHPIDIEMWILGDKLSVKGLQNCAMKRLYSHHTNLATRPSLTIDLVTYACFRTTSKSLLRYFYLDLLADNSTNSASVRGTFLEWATALQDYPDARPALRSRFRADPRQQPLMISEEPYLFKISGADPHGETRSETQGRSPVVAIKNEVRVKSEEI